MFNLHVNGGMVNFDITKDGRSIHVERFAGSSPTYRCYAYSGDGNNYNLRLSCYNCSFRSLKRYGDITVGDPWFIPNQKITNSQLKSYNVIRSLYSVNTEKGESLAKEIRRFTIEEQIKAEDAFCQPAVLPSRRDVPQLRKKLYSKVDITDYGTLVEELLTCNLDEAHAIFEKNYRMKCLKMFVFRFLKLLHIF